MQLSKPRAIILFYVLGLIFIAGISNAQVEEPHKVPTDWAVNPNSSPLVLTALPRAYKLKNRSDKRVVRFRFGCISGKEGSFRVAEEFSSKDTNLPPNWDTGGGSLHAAAHEVIIECVWKNKMKVAVIAVSFADGTNWKTDIPIDEKASQPNSIANPTAR